MLVIVTIFIFAIIIYSFKRFGRFITPTSVFCGGFLASCCSAIYFQKKWGFEMNGLTASVIILGILAFLWGASLAKRRFKYATNDSSIELMSFDISNKILDGYPVLVNFEKLGLQESNNMLSFLSGVVYATEGQTLRIQPRLFLLGRKEEFEDGTLYQYYEDLK